ncbi:MAG TPA: YggS family pyridoxal phosphate-dependent enzyme [Thermomicrobiales bacterium]|nr:YggS family pyridoxal phosphate-dependent enzyme [Thermomicrobiales bacterium]
MTGTYHPSLDTGLGKRIAKIRQMIDEAARRSGRTGQDVRLIGVSKTVTRASVNAAYAAGLKEFGENRVDMALEKFAENIPDDMILHMIGPLRGENIAAIPGRFALVHSVDDIEIANTLNRRAEISGVVQPVLVQVNVAREEQKHGTTVEDAPRLLEHVLGLSNLDVRGFMTMAPYYAEPEDTRPVFAELRELATRLQDQYAEHDLSILSMGMTNDFLVAVEEGSNMVRVGRAIFHAEHAL